MFSKLTAERSLKSTPALSVSDQVPPPKLTSVVKSSSPKSSLQTCAVGITCRPGASLTETVTVLDFALQTAGAETTYSKR